MTGGVNDPHVNEEVEAGKENPEDFFSAPEVEDAKDEVETLDPGPDSIDLEEEGVSAADIETEPESEAEPESEEAAAEPEAEPDADDDDDDESGSKNAREYVVYQGLTLDGEALQEMLRAVKAGGEPFTALVEVHRVNVTTSAAALRAAWKKHKDEWAEAPRLVALTANKARPRTAKPRFREVIGFDLVDD